MKKLMCLLLVLAMLIPSAALAKETTFTELYSSELKTLDYVDSTTTALTTFAMNCIMGLVYYDNFGLLRPGAAKNWSVSEDGTVYTFYLMHSSALMSPSRACWMVAGQLLIHSVVVSSTGRMPATGDPSMETFMKGLDWN